MQTTMRKNFVN